MIWLRKWNKHACVFVMAVIDDFLQIEIRVGTVVLSRIFDDARIPALKIWINFGSEIGQRQSSAQIAECY